MSAIGALFLRDMKVATRAGGGALMGVLFFLTLVTLMPFAVGPDLPLLGRIGPAVLWIGTLLSILLGLDRLVQIDADDGSLDIFRMSGEPLELIMLIKCLAHWIVTALPLIIAAPLFGLFLAMEPIAIWGTVITLILGSPALVFLGIIGAALTTTLQRGGLLLSILILPLTIPILIFGVSAATNYAEGGAALRTPLLFLGALTLISALLGPVAAAWAIRRED